MKNYLVGVSIWALLVLQIPLLAQNDAPAVNEQGNGPVIIVNAPPPRTQMEKVEAVRNAVITRGFTEIGTLQGEDGSALRISSVELIDGAKGDRFFGLAVEIRQSGRVGREAFSYVDEDEIAGLISAFDAIGKADNASTHLMNYEAKFHTRGDLEIANLDINGSRMIGIKTMQILTSGQVVTATSYFRLARGVEIQQQLQNARDVISKAKAEK